MTTWKELKNELTLSQENQNAIALEKDLIRTMVTIREEKGLTFNAYGIHIEDCANWEK